jgi:prepilin-type N-terminal cleavage/methylation domain-containing protein
MNHRNQKGFTLIEILVVIGMIALLATIVLIAINPARQFAQGRNTQRTSNVNAILNAIGQNIADNKGTFNCPGTSTLDDNAEYISATSSKANIMPCLVPTYISSVLVDPSVDATTSLASYYTGYTLAKDTNGRFTVCAPKTNEPNISARQDICITR